MPKLMPEGIAAREEIETAEVLEGPREIIQSLVPEVLQEDKKTKPGRKKRVEQEDLMLLSKVLSAGTNDGPKAILQTELEKNLIKHNLTTSSALEVISTVMHFSRKEVNKMNAAKLALELNGVLKNQEVVEDRQPTVQFVFNEQVNLNGIFNPKR